MENKGDMKKDGLQSAFSQNFGVSLLFQSLILSQLNKEIF